MSLLGKMGELAKGIAIGLAKAPLKLAKAMRGPLHVGCCLAASVCLFSGLWILTPLFILGALGLAASMRKSNKMAGMDLPSSRFISRIHEIFPRTARNLPPVRVHSEPYQTNSSMPDKGYLQQGFNTPQGSKKLSIGQQTLLRERWMNGQERREHDRQEDAVQFGGMPMF